MNHEEETGVKAVGFSCTEKDNAAQLLRNTHPKVD